MENSPPAPFFVCRLILLPIGKLEDHLVYLGPPFIWMARVEAFIVCSVFGLSMQIIVNTGASNFRPVQMFLDNIGSNRNSYFGLYGAGLYFGLKIEVYKTRLLFFKRVDDPI